MNVFKQEHFYICQIGKKIRKSDHAKGKLLNYTEFELAEYISPKDENISIEKQKLLFCCRVEDINIKGNNRWKYEDLSCLSCKKNVEETQFHILNCSALLGKNENITYIPDYNELFTGDLTEQMYVSKILWGNFNHRVLENPTSASQPM